MEAWILKKIAKRRPDLWRVFSMLNKEFSKTFNVNTYLREFFITDPYGQLWYRYGYMPNGFIITSSRARPVNLNFLFETLEKTEGSGVEHERIWVPSHRSSPIVWTNTS